MGLPGVGIVASAAWRWAPEGDSATRIVKTERRNLEGKGRQEEAIDDRQFRSARFELGVRKDGAVRPRGLQSPGEGGHPLIEGFENAKTLSVRRNSRAKRSLLRSV